MPREHRGLLQYLGVFIKPLKMPPAVALDQAAAEGHQTPGGGPESSGVGGQHRAGPVLSEALPQSVVCEPFCSSVRVLLPPGSVIHLCLLLPRVRNKLQAVRATKDKDEKSPLPHYRTDAGVTIYDMKR